MDKILVDTNVLIDYSKGKDALLGRLLEKQKQMKVELFVNPIIVAEFLTDRNCQKPTVLDKANEFLRLFSFVSIGKRESVLAGELLRTGAIDFIGDAFIGATCLVNELSLYTKNQKHFKKIKRLVLV